jgi:hypothetical protein
LSEITSTLPKITPTTSRLTAAEKWDHILARVGFWRGQHRVEPGLYALGSPTPESPVFVSANYTLSFDALRSALPGVDGYILVLNTRGINVWCAAGKGTFGTAEIHHQLAATRLSEVVSHRKLILPQLGAPGVAAHEVKRRTGFTVEYGPVLASGLPEYLKTHTATPEMRRVRFPFVDRLVLVPVEATGSLLILLGVAVVLYFTLGLKVALAALAIWLAGVVLFPLLLPWLPTPHFSTKGFILGLLAALPFAITAFTAHPDWTWYRCTGQALGYLLIMPAVVAFIALNFTGATTFTSRTGVKAEIFRFIPLMAWSGGAGLLLALVFAFVR